ILCVLACELLARRQERMRQFGATEREHSDRPHGRLGAGTPRPTSPCAPSTPATFRRGRHQEIDGGATAERAGAAALRGRPYEVAWPGAGRGMRLQLGKCR